jgi:hypothetical protein
MIMEDLGRKLRLACYDSSDGPRIMLFGPLDSDVAALQRCFKRLGRDRTQSLYIDELPFIAPFGGIRLLANCPGKGFGLYDRGLVPGIRRISTGPDCFTWNLNAEDWNDLAYLMKGLVQSTAPCHQYLARYPGEDAIVVLSKGEYSDEVLSR